MKRYDVCPVVSVTASLRRSRLVVVLQHEHLSDLATIVVAPLYPASELPLVSGVRVPIDVDGKSYVAAVDRLASLPTEQLKRPTANLGEHDYAFTKALDLLFSGF